MIETINYTLDITSDVCPLTFVRAKLLIEKMRPGETMELRLKGSEPLRNIPRSMKELGHAVLSVDPEPGQGAQGIHLMRIRKA